MKKNTFLIVLLILLQSICIYALSEANDLEDFVIEDGVLISYNGDKETVVIPSGISIIGPEVFEYNKTITSVVIPEGCTVISESAFFACQKLESVVMPSTLITIQANGFNGTALSSVDLPDGLQTIGNAAFFQCGTWTTIDIPDSVHSIGDEAFRWSNLEYLIVGDETAAEEYAKSNSIPYQIRGTDEINFPDEFVIVDGVLKSYNGQGGDVVIPDGVTVIGEEVFNQHVPVCSVTIPEGVTEIRRGAFFGMGSLTKVTFPSTLETIGDNAFYACMITEIVLPENLKTVGGNAFYNHNCQREIMIPGNVLSIGEKAFRSANSRVVIVVEKDSVAEEYAINDGLPYRYVDEAIIHNPPEYLIDETGTLLRYNGTGGMITIPDDVKTIANEVFYDNNDITGVLFPEGLEEIGEYSFFGCMRLTELSFPSTVKKFAGDSFGCCYGLKKLVFKNGITDIGARAFRVCSNIEEITFPASLTNIGEGAFEQIEGLKCIYYSGTADVWNNIVVGKNNDCLKPELLTYTGNIDDGNNSNTINATITVPQSAYTGEECAISYTITGGSGSYSDMRMTVESMYTINSGGHSLNSVEYILEEASGELSIRCPAASEACMNIYCHDDITGEDYWNVTYLALEQNPEFPVTFTYDKEEYYIGDTITIHYEIGGEENQLVNSKVIWGIEKKRYSPELPVETENIDAREGTVTYRPLYGDYVRLFVLAEDDKGNIIFGQTRTINLQAITPDMAQILPKSTIRIEEEAFCGTAFYAIEVPASVIYIDEHAFDNSMIRLIIGHSDYVKDYASRHNISYVER